MVDFPILCYFLKCQNYFSDLFECTIKKHKFLDIVVNNAGLLKDKEWEKTIAVNIVS